MRKITYALRVNPYGGWYCTVTTDFGSSHELFSLKGNPEAVLRQARRKVKKLSKVTKPLTDLGIGVVCK